MFKLAALVDEYAYLLAEDYAAAFAAARAELQARPCQHRGASGARRAQARDSPGGRSVRVSVHRAPLACGLMRAAAL
jgi:hypothetical protein